MSYLLTISPDFNPKHLAGWFVFNTWLQRALGEGVHLQLFDDFDGCRRAILSDQVDIIYANPADAALLLRQKGFLPLVHPRERPDEAIIAVAASSPYQCIEDLKPGLRIASTSDPEVETVCRIMLEPSELGATGINPQRRENYLLIAKDLIKGQADVGFFLAETFRELSQLVRGQLRILLQSQIEVVHHMLLIGPKLAARQPELQQQLLAMEGEAKGAAILRDIGVSAWIATDREQAEFMVDLMDTLS